MSNLTAFCIAVVVVLGLFGCLVASLHRLYEAEKRLARNAAREWDKDE